MKKLIILDLDNTLYDERDYFAGVFQEFETSKNLTSGLLLKRFDNLERNCPDILKSVLHSLDIYSKDNHEELFTCYCHAVFSIQLPEKSRIFLKSLKEMGCISAVLTNGVVKVQKNKVKNLGLDLLCDRVFYARENAAEYEKPDLRCFYEVLDYFGIDKSDALMIGDSYKNDYLGAVEAEIDALWFRGRFNNEITELAEALAYIARGNNEKN